MPITQETLVKNGIKIVQISASYDRKISDGQYGSMGGFFSMTADVEPTASIDDQLDMLFNFVRDAAAKHLRPEFAKEKAAIADRTDRAVNVDTQPATTAHTPPVTTPAAPAAPASGVMTLKIVKMQVAPRADGKVDLKFFEAGHQYPDISTAKTAADAVNMLKATGKWELFHFAQVAEFNVDFVIDYKNSAKLNSKGNPYKDILSVHPAA